MTTQSRYRVLGVLSAILLILVIVGIDTFRNLQHLKRDAEAVARAEMDYFNLMMNEKMKDIENIVLDMSAPVGMMLESNDSAGLFGLMKGILENHQNVLASMVVFLPDYYKDKGENYTIGAIRRDDKIIRSNLQDYEIDYSQREWYRIPVAEDRNVWTDPYYTPVVNNSVVTYGHPLALRSGTRVGVFTVDIPVDWMMDRGPVSKIFTGSEFMILNTKGEMVMSTGGITEVPDSAENFIYSGKIGDRGSRMLVSIPVKEVHADVLREAGLTAALSAALLLLLGFILMRVLKSARSMDKAETESKLMDKELSIAHNIQMGMVPDRFPAFPERKDIDIFAMMVPAKNIGGDFYDYFIRNEKLFFCIGDVSGKGIPASLLMATSITMFRTLSAKESNPQSIVSSMNEGVIQQSGRRMFVTLFVGVLDLPTGTLRYCNAGHNPPVILGLTKDKSSPLETDANMPIGVKAHYPYGIQSGSLASGETIFVYTDGVTESQDEDGLFFGIERMTAELDRMQDNTPKIVIDKMYKAVKSFEKGASPADDLSMLAIKYMPVKEEVLISKTLTLINRKEEIKRLGTFVEEFSEEAHLVRKEALRINLALEEIVTNSILYSYPEGEKGEIEIGAKRLKDKLVFTIVDSGKAFDPTAAGNVDLQEHNRELKQGGLGIFLVNKMMDAINYEYKDGKNILTLTKNYPDGEATE